MGRVWHAVVEQDPSLPRKAHVQWHNNAWFPEILGNHMGTTNDTGCSPGQRGGQGGSPAAGAARPAASSPAQTDAPTPPRPLQ